MAQRASVYPRRIHWTCDFQMGEHAFRFRCFEPREQPCGALEVVGCDRKLHPVLDCL
eukprot:CAMPEP_0180229786 /NCGR_PEP_ID=MMETSP0987-20121128/25771_1 /TAXON_ID=697907 /ORGANISM="non described non described, Strain CCMP2293" /LENGTH=56 /DNA_ID=CAMNT_0022194647 /DNA_START=698 /DNA_END=864 /DNA_ORIENTATION=+